MPVYTKYHKLEFYNWGCDTYTRNTIRAVQAMPHHNDHHYHVIAHRCGYQDNLLAYCWEHELAHCIVAEALTDSPSYVISTLAKEISGDRYLITAEEVLAQTLQRYIRAHEQPIISDVDWSSMRELFVAYLDNRKGT